MAIVILVCRLQRDGRRSCRRSSKSTGKPRPPTITATAIGRQIHGSPAKRTRLSA